MSRRRTTIFALGVCIGTFLLLFGDAFAQVTEASATPSVRFDSQTTPRAATTTVLTRVSPSHQNQSIREKDGQNVELRTAHDWEDGSRVDVGGDESRDEEKSDASRNEKIEDPSSDGGRKPRYGEISAGSSGKSTSTKAVSERPLGLSRTNELTIAATKPALNDSKQDNKRNSANDTLEESPGHEGIAGASTKEKLIAEKLSSGNNAKHDTDVEVASGNHTLPEVSFVNPEEKEGANTREITTVAPTGDSSATSEDVVKSDDRKGKIDRTDRKETKRDKSAVIVAELTDREDAEEQQLESRERESTTVRGAQHEDVPRKDATVDPGTTASEAFDLGKVDEKEREGSISLINDTYVNYKTQADKEAGDNSSARGQSVDVDESRGRRDPKEEVEVVENVTHQPILKIVDVANGTAEDDSRVNELAGGRAVYDKGSRPVKDEDHGEQRILSSDGGDASSVEGAEEEQKSIGEPEAQVKSLETTTLSIRPEERNSSTPKVTSSPIPQGRTIGFSGANEFPSVEVKSTPRTDGAAAPVVQSTEKTARKPYPYAKSGMELFEATTAGLKPRKNNSSGGNSVEETSAYENTIGTEESEKKFVVTEPSVVIENSIQQQKPDDKGANANSTTESSSLASVTVIPITQEEVGPTNETFPAKPNGGAKLATEDSRAANDDAPATKSEVKAIAGRVEGYDVTGNGITEVSLPPEAANGREGGGEEVKSREPTESSIASSTTSKVPSFNTDFQMEPEEAMMIRSTLVVTESTIVPLDTTTEANKSTTSMTPSVEGITASVENTTESAKSANATNQGSPELTSTLNPDESSVPTTTSIEFEFVGLTDPAVLPNATNTTTGKSVAGRTFEMQTTPSRITIPMPTIPFSAAKNNSTEDAIATMTTTTKPVATTTELPATTTTTEDETTDQVSTTTNETAADGKTAVTRPTVEGRSDRTEPAEVTAIDFTGAVTEAVETAGVTEDPSASKDSSFDANVTETSAPTELPPNPSVTTPPATNVTKSPSAPFAPATSQPEVRSNSTGSPEEEEDGTKSIQTLQQDEVTSLVKIVMEGTLQEICPRLLEVKNVLASVLTNGVDKFVSWKQIVIHQDPCLEPASSSSPTPTDVPLTPIYVFVVDEDGKFDAAMTKILPSLDKAFHDFPVRIRKFVLVQETDSGNAIAVVVVSSVAFICLVLLAGLLFIMRKRQTRFNYGERCRPVSLDAYSLDSVSAYSSVRRKVAPRTSKRSYGNPTFEDTSAIPSHPLNFAGLSSFCNEGHVIDEEFANIPQVSVKIDELPPGTEVKNRYANVIPLPETRVLLKRLSNDATTEYINASYVRGPKNATKYYIACQAPLDSTVTDFWRMIWEQQCKVIIMLTDLVENGVEKCTEYIPPSEVTDCHRLYGDFQVTLKKRETKEKYAISTLHLKNLENNTFREVFHIWYLWPVSGVESDGAGLIAVLLEARALQRGGPGPIVVHCSSGTGRTGTLIALDLGIRQYEITRTVDVPRVVYTIRRDRAGAVQTKEQYAFIYKALNLYATKLAGGVLDST